MRPPDWQRRMVEMIRGAAPLDGSWFAGCPWLDPLEQIGVYRQQFQLRLSEALDGELPGLRALMGEALNELYEAFLADHPPSSWSIDHVARPFADWLEARGADPCQVDMARLDAAVMACFAAADSTVLETSMLQADSVLVLSPSTRLLALRWDVHRLRSAALEGQVYMAPRPTPCTLALYRQGQEVRHWETSALQHGLLSSFVEPTSLALAAERALATQPEAASAIGAAFHEIARRGLLAFVGRAA